MPGLRELQAEVRAALLGGDGRAAAAVVEPDGLAPEARLAVYRHHVFASLTGALEATYPVAARLVDPRFFRYAADRYIRQAPPTSPCLFEYGGSFPDFLADFPATRHLAWLPDLARLEWAMNVALHAPDVAPLPPAALRESPVVGLHPSLTLLRSPWPLPAIWRAYRPGADGGEVELGQGGVELQVWRAADEVVFRALTPVDFAFRQALARTGALAAAAEAALGADAGADLAALVRGLLDDEVLVARSRPPGVDCPP